MTAQTKTVLKSYFETGDRPTEQQFADLIDSIPGDAGVLSESEIPATIARDTEVTAAVSAHAAASDPHGDRAYAAAQAAARKMLSDYHNVVVVDAGGNGDYTTLSAAMAAITDADVSNPYQVLVAPGCYSENVDIVFKNGVNVSAFGLGSVEIRLASGKSIVLSGSWSGMTEVFGIWFRCVTNTNPILMSSSDAPLVRFTHCRFTVDDVQNVAFAFMMLNHSAGAIEMHHCRVESLFDVAFSSVQIYLQSTGKLILRDCELFAYSDSGAYAVANIQIANSGTLSALRTAFLGGCPPVRSFSANTAILAHCEFSALLVNVTSAIAANHYNVQNANLTF